MTVSVSAFATRELAMSLVTVSLITQRRASRPWGSAGGEPGATGENWLLPGGDESRAERLRDKCTLHLKAGDVLRMLTPGGGGWVFHLRHRIEATGRTHADAGRVPCSNGAGHHRRRSQRAWPVVRSKRGRGAPWRGSIHDGDVCGWFKHRRATESLGRSHGFRLRAATSQEARPSGSQAGTTPPTWRVWVVHELRGYPTDAELADYRGPFGVQVREDHQRAARAASVRCRVR